MPDPEPLTPPAGTDPNPTPAPGTEAPPPVDQGTEQEPPDVKRYKEQLSGATREAQRLYQENQRLSAELQRRAPIVTEPARQAPVRITPKEFNDAIVEGREDVIEAYHNQLLETAIDRTEQKIYGQLNERDRYQQRVGTFDAFMRSTPGLADPKSGLWQEAVKEYKEIMADPYIHPDSKAENLQLIPPDQMTGNPGLRINETNFRLAVKLAEARRASDHAAAAEEVRQGQDGFVEPSGKGSGAAPGQAPAHGNKILLTADEKAVVAKIQKKSDSTYSEKRYWENLDPAVKAARLRSGRAE